MGRFHCKEMGGKGNKNFFCLLSLALPPTVRRGGAKCQYLRARCYSDLDTQSKFHAPPPGVKMALFSVPIIIEIGHESPKKENSQYRMGDHPPICYQFNYNRK
jgi:hypothetical protein